jgi:hypothetical protein
MSVGTRHLEGRVYRRFLVLRLRLLQLRLWLEQLVTSASRGLCIGLALALGGALALVAQSGAVDRANLMIVVAAGLGGGALWSLLRPPSLSRTARTADTRFQLEARLGTAVELLGRPGAGLLNEAQLVDAANALRNARGGWPLPLAVAWREGLLATAIVLTLLATLTFEGHGASLLVNLPSLPSEPGAASDERQTLGEVGVPPTGVPGSSGQGASNTTNALRTLDELRRAREAGTLGTDQAASVLDQVESELSRQAGEASGQREMLDRLSRALAQVSASEAAAESIQRGDYAQAGQQLAQLGQESDQLSAEAKRELSQALRSAAAESASAPTLAERERRAAEALAGRDYQATRSALAALGDEVARVSGQTPSQAELSEAMQRLQQERSDSGLTRSGGERGAPASGQPNTSARTGGSQAGLGEGNSSGLAGSTQAGEAEPGQNASQAPPDGQAERSGPSDLGAAAPRLDVAGKPVEVPVRPGAGGEPGSPTERASGDEQLVEDSQATFESDHPAVTVQAGGQAERIVVPGDQRQVVRDYFGRRGGRGRP